MTGLGMFLAGGRGRVQMHGCDPGHADTRGKTAGTGGKTAGTRGKTAGTRGKTEQPAWASTRVASLWSRVSYWPQCTTPEGAGGSSGRSSSDAAAVGKA
eukprot:93449-Chlamydomonas_euryale.AAC.1